MEPEPEDMYTVEYDFLKKSKRRQFYRYLAKILTNCHWKKSNNSVLIDNLRAALAVQELTRAYNTYTNVYTCVIVAANNLHNTKYINRRERTGVW